MKLVKQVNKRLNPLLLVSISILVLNLWALSVPSVKAQNYVDIQNWSICNLPGYYRNVGERECPKPEDNPGTYRLQYRLRLTQTSARPGDKIGIIIEFSVSWQYTCPTEVWSCDDVQRFFINFLSAFSNRATDTGTIFGAPDDPNKRTYEVSIDTGGLTAQPLVINPDIVQSLGLRPDDTASPNFQKIGSSTTDFVIPAGVQPGTYQLKATYMWTPFAAAEAAAGGGSLGVPSTEPVQLIVGAGQAQSQQQQQQQQNPAVGGGGTPSVTPTAAVTAAEGTAAAGAGIVTGEALSHFRKPGEKPSEATAEEKEAGATLGAMLLQDAIVHGPGGEAAVAEALFSPPESPPPATQQPLATPTGQEQLSPPESAPEPVQQSSGDLIKQLQDSLRAEQDHMQRSPPESPTVVQQTPINLADPAQVQQALDGFNQSVQSSQDVQDALNTYSGKSVTIQIDDNQSTVQINPNGLTVSSSPADPTKDMFVKFTSDEIKQLRQDLADIRSGDSLSSGLAKADLGFRLTKKLGDGTTKNVDLTDLRLAMSLAKNLGKGGGSAPK